MNMWMADSFYFYTLLDQRSLCLMQRWAEVLFSMIQNPRLRPISKRSCILAAHAHEGCLEKSLVSIETNQQNDLLVLTVANNNMRSLRQLKIRLVSDDLGEMLYHDREVRQLPRDCDYPL
jgi:hypothetical protein